VSKNGKNENQVSILQFYCLVKLVSCFRSGYPPFFANEKYLLKMKNEKYLLKVSQNVRGWQGPLWVI